MVAPSACQTRKSQESIHSTESKEEKIRRQVAEDINSKRSGENHRRPRIFVWVRRNAWLQTSWRERANKTGGSSPPRIYGMTPREILRFKIKSDFHATTDAFRVQRLSTACATSRKSATINKVVFASPDRLRRKRFWSASRETGWLELRTRSAVINEDWKLHGGSKMQNIEGAEIVRPFR